MSKVYILNNIVVNNVIICLPSYGSKPIILQIIFKTQIVIILYFFLWFESFYSLQLKIPSLKNPWRCKIIHIFITWFKTSLLRRHDCFKFLYKTMWLLSYMVIGTVWNDMRVSNLTARDKRWGAQKSIFFILIWS